MPYYAMLCYAILYYTIICYNDTAWAQRSAILTVNSTTSQAAYSITTSTKHKDNHDTNNE